MCYLMMKKDKNDLDDSLVYDETQSCNSTDTDKLSVTGRRKYRKRSKPTSNKDVDSMELSFLQSVGEILLDNTSQRNENDEAAIFGELIATQLQQLPFEQRQMA